MARAFDHKITPAAHCADGFGIGVEGSRLLLERREVGVVRLEHDLVERARDLRPEAELGPAAVARDLVELVGGLQEVVPALPALELEVEPRANHLPSSSLETDEIIRLHGHAGKVP